MNNQPVDNWRRLKGCTEEAPECAWEKVHRKRTQIFSPVAPTLCRRLGLNNWGKFKKCIVEAARLFGIAVSVDT